MLKSYLTIGLRNFLKQKLFTLINISGMSISLCCFLLIALYIHDEYRFDQHIRDAENKFRVYNVHYYEDGRIIKGSMIPPPLVPQLAVEFPEVESYARFMNFNSPVLFKAGDKKFTEGQGGYADPAILAMLSLTLLEGDPAQALHEPGTIVISRTLKEKYFGDKSALGQVIEIFEDNFKVGAVFEDFPSHSHLRLNYFISISYLVNLIPDRMQNWGWSQFHSYVQLKPGTDLEAIESKLEDFAERHAWAETERGGSYYIPRLMPIRDIHLHASDHFWDIAVRGNAQTVYILSATALFILIIAILNFINLSTARAITRVKEVGVRKVVGAFRTQLLFQFVTESVIIALISLVIGGMATELLLPLLNNFTEKDIPHGIFLDPLAAASVLVFAVVIGIAAGAYPAFFISSYRPAQILSNKARGGSGKNTLRKGLVVLQFILSFFLIIASVVVSEQHTYMRTKDMGFDKNNVIVLQLRGEMQEHLQTVKAEFAGHPNVESASLGYGLPGEAYAGDGIKDKETDRDIPVSMLTVDHDYIQTLGIELIAGRDFSERIPSDEKHAFIVSETAAKALGYPEPGEALEHEVVWPRWDAPDSLKEGKVIGVVKDFHLNSLKESIAPVVLHVYPFAYSSLSLRIKPQNMQETIAHLEETWKSFNTEWPFEYRFLDANFDKMYKSEEKLATLFLFFTGFTIFVACLGLFGLVVYSTTQRYREISIRKVLGAAESALVVQLSRSYMILIFIAFIIAVPVSYYAVSGWLQTFPYRIDLSAMLFVKSGLLVIAIALLTVGVQSYKAARANPVDALKEQ